MNYVVKATTHIEVFRVDGEESVKVDDQTYESRSEFPFFQKIVEPVIDTCKECGKPFVKNHNRRQLCPECGKASNRASAYRERKKRADSDANKKA